MSAPDLSKLQLTGAGPERLSARAILLNHVLTLSLSGTGEIPDQVELHELLKRLHQTAVANQVTKVELDFQALKFMNSSCFKAFVSWLAEVTQMPKPSQYGVHFKLSPTRRWQRVSVSALSCFAIGLITFEPA